MAKNVLLVSEHWSYIDLERTRMEKKDPFVDVSGKKVEVLQVGEIYDKEDIFEEVYLLVDSPSQKYNVMRVK